MSDLYLIAHKVRGEPAFDVAERMECPECHGTSEYCTDAGYHDCTECDQLGYWWIIPTSGHRAYPYWSIELQDVDFRNSEHPDHHLREMPLGLPDHYLTSAPHDKPKLNLAALMPKAAPIRRRV